MGISRGGRGDLEGHKGEAVYGFSLHTAVLSSQPLDLWPRDPAVHCLGRNAQWLAIALLLLFVFFSASYGSILQASSSLEAVLVLVLLKKGLRCCLCFKRIFPRLSMESLQLMYELWMDFCANSKSIMFSLGIHSTRASHYSTGNKQGLTPACLHCRTWLTLPTPTLIYTMKGQFTLPLATTGRDKT